MREYETRDLREWGLLFLFNIFKWHCSICLTCTDSFLNEITDINVDGRGEGTWNSYRQEEIEEMDKGGGVEATGRGRFEGRMILKVTLMTINDTLD